jgi:hypothetical protein
VAQNNFDTPLGLEEDNPIDPITEIDPDVIEEEDDEDLMEDEQDEEDEMLDDEDEDEEDDEDSSNLPLPDVE